MGTRRRLLRGPHVDDATLRRCWEFRLEHMALREGVDLEDDYASYAAWIRAGGVLWLAEDAGRVVGTCHLENRPIEHDGQRLIWVRVEYGFLAPEVRTRMELQLIAAVTVLSAFVRHPWTPKIGGAATYLPSYLTFTGILDTYWSAADVPERWSGLFHRLAVGVGGDRWDAATGLLRLNTRPRDASTRRPRSPGNQMLYDRYVEENPRWTDGYGIFVITPLTAAHVARSLARVLARRLRRAVTA